MKRFVKIVLDFFPCDIKLVQIRELDIMCFSSSLHFVKVSCQLALLVGLSACSLHSQPISPYQKINSQLQHVVVLPLAETWWVSFADDQLNNLIALGLKNNASLTANLARVKSSEETLIKTQSDFYPDLNLSTSKTLEFDKKEPVHPSSFAFSSTWNLDLWGRISALEEKAQWDIVARKALYKDRANLVVSNIALAWYNWLGELDKKQLYAEQYQRTDTALKIITRRFTMGKNSVTDIWQQQRLLDSIAAQQETNKARLALYTKQLALWAGVSEADLPQLTEKNLPNLTRLPETGISLAVLQHRPDVQQAYAELQASNANLAAAITDRFPRITFSARYSTSRNNTAKLFDDWVGNFIASLTMPIFDAGNISANIKQQEYLLEAELADFKQVWLEAIYDVERALLNEEEYYNLTQSITAQRELSKKTEKVISLKYLHGKTNYVSLLRAQETNQNIERQLIDAQKSLITNRITLYRELSSGNFSAQAQFSPITIAEHHE